MNHSREIEQVCEKQRGSYLRIGFAQWFHFEHPLLGIVRVVSHSWV